jgi:hypothetical protein
VITKLYYQVDEIAQTGDPLVDVEVRTSPTQVIENTGNSSAMCFFLSVSVAESAG